MKFFWRQVVPQTFDNNQDTKLANPVPHAQLSRMIEQGRSFSGKRELRLPKYR